MQWYGTHKKRGKVYGQVRWTSWQIGQKSDKKLNLCLLPKMTGRKDPVLVLFLTRFCFLGFLEGGTQLLPCTYLSFSTSLFVLISFINVGLVGTQLEGDQKSTSETGGPARFPGSRRAINRARAFRAQFFVVVIFLTSLSSSLFSPRLAWLILSLSGEFSNRIL